MSETRLKDADIVINTRNGNEYYITKVEEMYNVDLGHSIPTGYVECRPNNLDDNLPNYNRFSIDDLELKE